MLGAFLESEVWRAVQDAGIVHTELPVASLTDGARPTVTDGTIDLLYRSSGAWHLVDFKTEPVPAGKRSSVLRRYEDQLDTYAAHWERATGTTIAEKGLWLADAETEVILSAEERD
jgi:ATP-dependent exoDNAse (exonuclease V) beta subunit